MGLYSAIGCAEEHATVSESMTLETGVAASVTLRCMWADRFLLMADILATPRVWPNGGFIIPPRAQSAVSKGDGAAYLTVGQQCEYEHAIVTVNYSHKIVDVISEALEPTAEFITVDPLQFAWGSPDGEKLLPGEAPGYLLRSCNLVRTHYNIPSIPPSALTLIGCSNHAVYTSTLLGLTFPVETLLFQPPMPSRTITSVGSSGWTLGMKFSFKPQGWNKFWRPSSPATVTPPAPAGQGAFDMIYHIKGGQYKPHPPGDFSAFLY